MQNNEPTTSLELDEQAFLAEEVAKPQHSAPAPEVDEYDHFDLPSGRKASMLKAGKGKHVRLAARLVGTDQSAIALGMALASVKGLIDGKAFTYEDLDDMPQADVMMLMGKAMGGGKSQSSLPSI